MSKSAAGFSVDEHRVDSGSEPKSNADVPETEGRAGVSSDAEDDEYQPDIDWYEELQTSLGVVSSYRAVTDVSCVSDVPKAEPSDTLELAASQRYAAGVLPTFRNGLGGGPGGKKAASAKKSITDFFAPQNKAETSAGGSADPSERRTSMDHAASGHGTTGSKKGNRKSSAKTKA
ncbi:hypothetical protein I317_05455 [Kwoniella heveanensis CBS 569]|nr:hypothetical protein I317_05455 [Kwoniella heveanensis CBS 569]